MVQGTWYNGIEETVHETHDSTRHAISVPDMYFNGL